MPADDLHNLADPGGDFCRDQRKDPTLSQAYDQLTTVDGMVSNPQWAAQWPWFELRRDWLYQVERNSRSMEPHAQLVVPRAYWMSVLRLAHIIPAAGHLDIDKTLAQVLAHFYWPGVHHEVQEYCTSCLECQRAAPARVPWAPLVPRWSGPRLKEGGRLYRTC